MRISIVIAALLLAAAAAAAQTAGTNARPCALLTGGDVGAFGATGAVKESQLPITSGSQQGQTMRMCDWPMDGGKGSVSVSVLPFGMACYALAKNVAIAVGVNGPSRVAIDRVNGLLDKAVGRLP